MKFEEDFPSLKGKHHILQILQNAYTGDTFYVDSESNEEEKYSDEDESLSEEELIEFKGIEYQKVRVIKFKDIQENCLDKQRVRDILVSEFSRRIPKDKELLGRIQKELGL